MYIPFLFVQEFGVSVGVASLKVQLQDGKCQILIIRLENECLSQ